MKSIITISICLFALSANANMQSWREAGVMYFRGTYGGSSIFIAKYKDSGHCYTKGSVDGKNFFMEVYRDSGNLYQNGNIPPVVGELLRDYDWKPFSCSVFGISG